MIKISESKISRRDFFKKLGLGAGIVSLLSFEKEVLGQPQCLGYGGKFSKISEVRDPYSDFYPPFGDIQQAGIYKEETREDLLFKMNLFGDIPLNPDRYVAYIWGLDIDRNPYTGFRNGDIGVDYNVR